MLFKKQTALDEIFFQYLPPFLFHLFFAKKKRVEPKERVLALLLACAKSISTFSLPKRKGGAKRKGFSATVALSGIGFHLFFAKKKRWSQKKGF